MCYLQMFCCYLGKIRGKPLLPNHPTADAQAWSRTALTRWNFVKPGIFWEYVFLLACVYQLDIIWVTFCRQGKQPFCVDFCNQPSEMGEHLHHCQHDVWLSLWTLRAHITGSTQVCTPGGKATLNIRSTLKEGMSRGHATPASFLVFITAPVQGLSLSVA